MPQVLPMTRVEAYLAYKAGVISEADLKPSLKTNFYSGLENWLAYWCGLTADYPKDENNDPKWYTEEEYYIAYLCGIAPDYPVNCYRRVGAYLRYIISARWDKPEKPLTREEYYLSLMSTTYLPPNDPASIITLDNTVEAPFGDLKIYGDATQATTTGKNLFVAEASASLNGVDLTLNADGTYTLEGIASGNANFALFIPIADVKVTAGSAYAFSSTNALPAGVEVRYEAYTTNSSTGWLRHIVPFLSSTRQSSTTSSANLTDALYVRQNIFVASNTALTTPVTFGIQLEAGDSPTSFEPYTAGASPNPEYPQDINVVTGEQTVKVTGKNLLSLTDGTYTNRGVQVVVSNGRLTINRVSSDISTAFARVRLIEPITFRAGDTITLSANNTDTIGTGNPYMSIRLNNGTGDIPATDVVLNVADSHTTYTFGTETTIEQLTIRCAYQLSPQDFIVLPQLELGSTASDYVPYQSQSYEINLGKNLFDKDNVTELIGQVTANLTFDTTATNARTIVIPCRPNTPYAVSKITKGSRTRVATATGRVDQGSGSFTNYSQDNVGAVDNRTAVYLTSGANDKYLYFTYGQTSDSDFANILPSIQIEVGSLATHLAAYFTPIELCKIGDYQDYIWTDGEKWYKHKEIEKAVYDGSADEAWLRYDGATANYWGFYIAVSDAISNSPCLCNSFTRHDKTPWMSGVGTFRISNALNAIFEVVAKDGDLPTLAEWRESLNDNNLIVYYPLATPTDEEITNATLISQLNVLLEGGSYDYQTNIVVSAADPNLPGLLQVTAAKWQ
jgi:hypothetical protein